MVGIGGQRNRLERRFAVVDRAPDLLGDERHERSQQAQRALEDAHQVGKGGAGFVAIRREQARLEQLDIPVAILTPEEVIDNVRRLVEAILARAPWKLRRRRD